MRRVSVGRVAMCGFVMGVAFLAGPSGAGAARPSLQTADYRRAEALFDTSARRLVRGAFIEPHWLENSDSFWYRSDAESSCVLFDAATGDRSRPVDLWRLATAINSLAEVPVLPSGISVTDLEPGAAGVTVRASAAGQEYVCTVPEYQCLKAAPTPPVRVSETVSPDGRSALFVRGDDLWTREVDSGAERRLTTDGVPYFAYGKWPDSSLQTVVYLRSKEGRPPYEARWSPDSRFIVGQRCDERAIAGYPFVEWAPQDGSYRPLVYDIRLPLLGDPEQGHFEAFAIDVRTARKTVLVLPDGWSFSVPDIGWSRDGRRLYGLAATPGDRKAALVESEPATGRTRLVIEEESPTHVELNAFLYSAPNVRILKGGEEAIWFSERDGWGHLYLYDTRTGALKHRITGGQWLVKDILRVDEERGTIDFTGTGREPGRDPYFRHLYRVPIGGGPVTLLTPENADHEFMGPISPAIASAGSYVLPEMISPSGNYLVDTYSTVDEPPVTVVRSAARPAAGVELERADASRLRSAGYKAPERFRATADDGTTEIYGVIFYPPGYERNRTYPVIDAFYGGPQTINAPRNFMGAVSTVNPVSRASLAQLGFIVVTIDGRGTPGRSKAFHDAGYGAFADPQIEDHVAALREIGPARGFDLDRVGVYGHSFGGYTSVRAMLKHPEFFKVGVSSAGPQLFESVYTGLEIFLGIPHYEGGGAVRPAPAASPEPYHAMDNRLLASRLQGRLLLAYGDMDENAPPAATLQLAEALIRANRRFDLLYLPNRTHSFVREPYFVLRMWDYFVENLLGAVPPGNYEWGAAP
jgi:dipeptidyl-peptidase-4